MQRVIGIFFEKNDTMIRPLHYLFLFGMFWGTAYGTVCELTHCMKCQKGKCTECEYGWYGSHCNRRCQDQCWHGGCKQKSGICIQCTPGFYTVSCHKRCPHNCRVSYDKHRYCNRTTGYCLEGCKNSYWGLKCDQTCNENCQESVCEQNSGFCLEGCTDGWYGQTCNKKCPENCRDKKCSNFGGECLSCAHGFHGRTCNISCHNCLNEECHVNELDLSVKCTIGCKDGWASTDCQCSSKCKDGKCKNNGTCMACSEGYYGELCENKCAGVWTGVCIEIITETRASGQDIHEEEHVVANFEVQENVSTATVHSAFVISGTYLLVQMVSAYPSYI